MGIKTFFIKVIDSITHLPIIDKIVLFAKRIVLPGFQGIPLYDAMKFFIEAVVKGTIFQRASAMTYRIFIAIIPMLLALFSVISFLGENIKNNLLSFIQSGIPEYIWPAISNIITEVIMRQNGTLLSFSFGFGIYFTIIGINAVINTLNTTYFDMSNRNIFKQLLLSCSIMCLCCVGILVMVSIFIGASFAINYLNNQLFESARFYMNTVYIVKWVLLFVFVYLLISTFYYLAPAKKEHYRFFSAGSSLATILMTILLYALNYYFSNFANYNIIYGSMGALFAILLWLYWNSMVILICYDLNVSIAAAKISKTQSVQS